MEFEQIIKKLEWLDEERRKDKATISAQVEHFAVVEGSLSTLTAQVKNLEKELSTFSTVSARVNQFDNFLARQRNEMNETFEKLEKNAKKREKDTIQHFQVELPPINEALAELRKQVDVSDIRRDLKARESDDIRLSNALTEINARFDEVLKNSADIQHTYRLAEEGQRQGAKQLTDTQGEISALRKRLDEEREKHQLNADNLRNIETRVADVLSNEHKRKQEQSEFIDQQSIQYADRERTWKEWLEKADTLNQQTELLETQLQVMNDATRSAKKAEETYAEISQRIERRVHEITEMQRLAEDRLRQEWVTFKADDQKRWTGYGLSQDETMKNLQKTMEKIEARLTTLDDASQTMQDQIQQTTDITERQMQEMMNWAHEWLTSYERVMGHARKNS